MMDELSELNDIDPVRPEHLVAATAIDSETLLELFESDTRSGRGRLLKFPRLPSGSARVGYVGAGLLVAAGFVAVALVNVGDVSYDLEVIEPAGEAAADASPVEDSVLIVPESEPSGEETTANGAEIEPDTGTDDAVVTPQPDEESTPTTTAPEETPEPNDSNNESTDDDVGNRPSISGPFNPADDLLALHYEHSPSRDDGVATVAAREITTWLKVEPHVVSGTYGTNARRFDPESATVMNATWDDAWLDADGDWDGAVRLTADRWQQVLDADGHVWVAEGGQSDFTSDVLREIMVRMPDLSTEQRIHVVQHSSVNERATTTEDLALVQAETDYIKIDDGNRDNDTADLAQPSAEFITAALASEHSSGWEAAFDRLDPKEDLDFSDTVEVLHILGVGTDEVDGPTSFARFFMTPSSAD